MSCVPSSRFAPVLKWPPAAGNNSVGDYITVCFSGGKAFPVFAIASVPRDGKLDEAMYTMTGGLAIDARYGKLKSEFSVLPKTRF